jgi:hypothetical protein
LLRQLKNPNNSGERVHSTSTLNDGYGKQMRAGIIFTLLRAPYLEPYYYYYYYYY